MCKTKMAIDASEPDSIPTPRPASRTPKSSRSKPSISSNFPSSSTSYEDSGFNTNASSSATVSASSRTSLSSLRDSLPETPQIYDFNEICSSTNNFLAKRYSATSSTPSWRCTLRGKDVVIFQRKFRRKIELPELRDRLYKICRSHHTSIIKLLGASVSGEHVYLVYDFVNGANLADCLRNSKNPNFTVLSTWISRMHVATDLAHGLDYIHNKTGLNMSLTHNHIKSSSIMVTEPSFNGKICHFGAAQLCGEDDDDSGIVEGSKSESKLKELNRSGSRKVQFEGVRGYMAPEYKSSGVSTQKTDVYAFGVVILELISGEEPLKFKFDKNSGDFMRISLIESATAVMEGGDGEEKEAGEISSSSGLGVEGRLRRWLDRRLKDSFPVDVAEKLTRLALECVHVEPTKRPDMARVAGKISKLYLESRIWSDNMRVPTSMSVSLAPR